MPVKNTSHTVYCVFSLIRWMYWTDVRSKRPKIESAWMDGTSRRALVTTRLGNPTGLTIDYSMGNRIYWCDSKENLIESMAWDGSDRVVVVNSGRFWSCTSWRVFFILSINYPTRRIISLLSISVGFDPVLVCISTINCPTRRTS